MIEIESMWLLQALGDHGGTAQSYLDRHTGEIIRVSDDDVTGEEEELRGRVEADPDRWIEIEPLPSSDGFTVMENFIGALPESEDKRTLERAISYKKPFSNFKQALSGMPDIRKQWFELEEKSTQKAAEIWLKAQGLEARLV